MTPNQKTENYLNQMYSSCYCEEEASGMFLQQLKMYAEEYKNYFVEPMTDREVNSGIVQEK